jgi:hypothetical protein
MSKATVLFFAADPLSAPPGGMPRLLLDEDVRRIRTKVRAAEYRDALQFDLRLAARPDDLIQALNETRPHVVHFSGHGRSEGLVLVGSDGGAHLVGAEALTKLFRVFRGDIRVVVLNACLTLGQAQAIAETVGCAIGTRDRISDDAATTFGAAFYSALAFGHSVQTAFEQARVALALEHPGEEETPEIIAGPGVDPAHIFVVRGDDRAAAADAGDLRAALERLMEGIPASRDRDGVEGRTRGERQGPRPIIPWRNLPPPGTPDLFRLLDWRCRVTPLIGRARTACRRWWTGPAAAGTSWYAFSSGPAARGKAVLRWKPRMRSGTRAGRRDRSFPTGRTAFPCRTETGCSG